MQASTVPRPVVMLYRSPRDPRSIICQFPYSPAAIAAIRDVPGRTYDPTTKVWSIPVNAQNVLALKQRLAQIGWGLELGGSLRDELNEQYAGMRDAAKARAAGDSNIAFDYFTEPYAHQRAGLEFLVRLGGGALFWEMGLGKTKTAVDYAEYLAKLQSPFRVLVLCPNSVKRNWGAEITKHANHADYVVLAGPARKRKAAIGTARYTIANVEMLSAGDSIVPLRDYPWDLVIVDESTRFKSPQANRTKALFKMKARHRVILTGTPITGKPEDAWAQLEFVQPGIFGKFWNFRDRYLALDFFGHVTGIKPGLEREVADRIDSVSYRILKSQVLDLPPKVYTDRFVKMQGEQLRAYNQMKDELRIEIEMMEVVRASTVLTMLLRLTQVTAGLVGSSDAGYQWLGDKAAKIVELDDLLNDDLRDEQVVIYGQYQRELQELAKRYASWSGPHAEPPGLPIIYGPTPEPDRARLIAEFQAGDRRRLFVQTRTGGIGITLTAAKTAIYHTRSWSLEEYLQSQDRLHRIGQTGTVTILHLRAEGSIDDDIADALNDKQALADDLTGDRVRKLAGRILAR